MKKVINYFKRTWKNKVWSMVMLVIALIEAKVLGTGTMLVMFICFGLPMFFYWENGIED